VPDVEPASPNAANVNDSSDEEEEEMEAARAAAGLSAAGQPHSASTRIPRPASRAKNGSSSDVLAHGASGGCGGGNRSTRTAVFMSSGLAAS